MNASKDENRVPTLLATLDSDGVTPTRVVANPTNHGLSVSDGTTGSGVATTNAERDENRVPTLWAVSDVDGVTPVAVWCDSNGYLLIDSN